MSKFVNIITDETININADLISNYVLLEIDLTSDV